MKLFNAILGVFAAFAAMFCFMYPGRTGLTVGWMLAFLLLCWGICAIFESVSNKEKSKTGKITVIRGILAVIAGLFAGCASVAIIVKPMMAAVITDMIFIWIFLIWIMTSGISTVFNSVIIKKAVSGKKWIFVLIIGILTILLSIYGMCHILLAGWALTVIFGVLLMGYSIRLLASVFE